MTEEECEYPHDCMYQDGRAGCKGCEFNPKERGNKNVPEQVKKDGIF